MHRVALVGSSGGNLHRLGGDDPAELIRTVADQLRRAGIELAAVCFVGADASLDAPGDRATGVLWSLDAGVPRATATGSLDDVNAAARLADERVAAGIRDGAIDGLVLVSADPADVNRASVTAAARCGVPAVGSGGTSVAAAQAMGLRLLAASGTTGTTHRTRAISYAAGLSRHWRLPYRPVDRPGTVREALRRYDPRPVLVDALPAILALAVVVGLSGWAGGSVQDQVASRLLPLVPVVVAFVAAVRVSDVGPAGPIAGLVAGSVCLGSGLVGALPAGFLAGTVADLLVTTSLRWGWPATASGVLGSGVAGLLAGAPAHLLLAGRGHALDVLLADGLLRLLHQAGPAVGALLGLLMWPFVLRGLYHSLVLPLMVVEFSAHARSFLAALDLTALIVVSAGVATAAAWQAPDAATRAAARRTVFVNLGFGTFVEGSYPWIRAGRRRLAFVMGCAAVGGAFLGAVAATGVAYVPVALLPLVGSEHVGLLVAIAVTYTLAVIGSLLLGRAARPE